MSHLSICKLSEHLAELRTLRYKITHFQWRAWNFRMFFDQQIKNFPGLLSGEVPTAPLLPWTARHCTLWLKFSFHCVPRRHRTLHFRCSLYSHAANFCNVETNGSEWCYNFQALFFCRLPLRSSRSSINLNGKFSVSIFPSPHTHNSIEIADCVIAITVDGLCWLWHDVFFLEHHEDMKD